jgi:hypothetical protein
MVRTKIVRTKIIRTKIVRTKFFSENSFSSLELVTHCIMVTVKGSVRNRNGVEQRLDESKNREMEVDKRKQEK